MTLCGCIYQTFGLVINSDFTIKAIGLTAGGLTDSLIPISSHEGGTFGREKPS